MGLMKYRHKRNFNITDEPSGKNARQSNHPIFVIQKHGASHLHYDFRLEMNGVLKSWAIPKGPSLDPSVKRLSVEVEDHPIEYASFEGVIPEKQYGAGPVMIWDRGYWSSLELSSQQAYKKGKMTIQLFGEKLQGRWHLIKIKNSTKNNWLLVKAKDKYAKTNIEILKKKPFSVISKKTLDQIKSNQNSIIHKNTPARSAHPAHSIPKRKVSPSDHPVLLKMNDYIRTFPEAHRQKIPGALKPELAYLVDKTPQGNAWLHEIKYDGYRILCFIKNGKISLVTRNGKNWTQHFPGIVADVEKLKLNNAILDGELVALDNQGNISFQELQESIKTSNIHNIYYYIFDLIYLNEFNLSKIPLINRKKLLKQIFKPVQSLQKNHSILYSEFIIGNGQEMFDFICKNGLEGMVSKKLTSPYENQRSTAWLKSKCGLRQEFVIAGFTPPQGTRKYFGALLLGVYNQKHEFIYCGKVGTGFSNNTLAQIFEKMKKYISKSTPFSDLTRVERKNNVTWLKPRLIAEISFTEFTREGILRHPSFQALRLDKKPEEVQREQAVYLHPSHGLDKQPDSSPAPHRLHSRTRSNGSQPDADDQHNIVSPKKNVLTDYRRGTQSQGNEVHLVGIELTHPDKILYPPDKITKLDLAEYYESIADKILPHLTNRPLSILRCPNRFNQTCFFQKHLNQRFSKHLHSIKITGDDKDYFYIKNIQGLIALVQLSALEIHPWGSQIDNIEKPDLITLDLDPDSSISWQQLRESTLFIRDQLDTLGLEGFLKTTGGKGLHIVIPIARKLDWKDVKSFTQLFALKMCQLQPDRFVATASKSKRAGKIFLDYLRNGRGATSVAAYSTRARLHCPISMPIAWQELKKIKSSSEVNLLNINDYLKKVKKDPWADFSACRQSLSVKVIKNIDKLLN